MKMEEFKPGDSARVYGYGIDEKDKPTALFCGEVVKVRRESVSGFGLLLIDAFGETYKVHPRQLEKFEPPKPREFKILRCNSVGDKAYSADVDLVRCSECIEEVLVREVLPESKS